MGSVDRGMLVVFMSVRKNRILGSTSEALWICVGLDAESDDCGLLRSSRKACI